MTIAMTSPPEFVNHYAALGLIVPTNDFDILKRAWRHACKAAHPDHGGSNEKQARVNVAWEILRDEKRRATYMGEYRNIFKGTSPPVPPRPPRSSARPGPGSTGFASGGSRPPPTGSSRPSSGTASAKRPAEESPPADSKRQRVSADRPSSGCSSNRHFGNRGNSFKDSRHAAPRFVHDKNQVKADVLEAVFMVVHSMADTSQEYETVRARLLRPGSGITTVAACIVDALEDMH